MTQPRLTWVRYSQCESDSCVEVSATHTHDVFFIRDSKNPDTPALVFTEKEFAAFLAGAKAGEFDSLLRRPEWLDD